MIKNQILTMKMFALNKKKAVSLKMKVFESMLDHLPFPSIPFPSLPFPSLPFPSLPFPSLRFASLPFPSLPFLSFPFLSLPFPSLPFSSILFSSLSFPSICHFTKRNFKYLSNRLHFSVCHSDTACKEQILQHII